MVAENVETLGHGGDRKNQDANLQVEREEAAKLLNVSQRSIASAKKVKESGVPELAEKVQSSEVAVSTASAHFLTSRRSGAIFGNNRRALLTGTFIHTRKRGEALCRTAYTK